MRSCRPVRRVMVVGMTLLSALCIVAPAHGSVIAPPVRALELPAGVASISADDPLLAPILTGASSTGGPVVHNLDGQILGIGKRQVTWRDLSDNTTLTKYIYLYPCGYQVLGAASNLRIFEHNGARHILYDQDNRVHVIYNDGVRVWYRMGVRVGNRLQWRAPVQVNSDATPIGTTSYGTRGQTFALFTDAAGNVNLQCVWSSWAPVSRTVDTRRLVVDGAGSVTAGDIVNTGLIGSFPSIVNDSTGRFHLAVESSSYAAGPWIHYVNSTDGVTWANPQLWYGSQTGCNSYRFVNLVVDSKDRIHAAWQAGGYQGYSGAAEWWVGLYSMRNAQTGQWSAVSNIVAGVPGWQAPTGSQDILFAYPNLLVDDRDNLHVSWHGTARSFLYAWDDVFYMKKVYSPVTDSWGPWSGYTALHKRDHFKTGDGEDQNYTWVPSLAYKPGSDSLYAVMMFGTGDDEVSDPSVNLTDGLLKIYAGGAWQAGFQNVTQTSGLRSWYSNVPSTVQVDRNGRTWLDVTWIDGTLDDYNVLFRRVDLGGASPGDCNGDGHVDVADLLSLASSWGHRADQAGYDVVCDFNGDDIVDVVDLLILAEHWSP
jgi:hypothetical protein